MGLETYQQKRDFRRTPEPKGKISRKDGRRFVVQEHHASMLHFDFRLEMDGVLKSWSVRRGPSLDPSQKRLAVPTEDHPVEYLDFEGHIPEGQYGAGEHMKWDGGTYEPTKEGDPAAQIAAGRFSFRLKGEKLRGEFHLVRMGRKDQWLLFKGDDEFAQPGWQLKLRVETDDAAQNWLKEQKRERLGASKKSNGTKNRAGSGGDARAKSKGKAAREGGAKRDGGNEGVEKYDVRERAGDAKTVTTSTLSKRGPLSGDVNFKVGRELVALTSVEKVYWPEDGYTKLDLIRYYYEVAPFILPYLKDRPLIMKRYPNGIRQHYFHQHDVDEVPDYVRTAALEVEEAGGHTVDYVVCDNVPTLLYVANLGAIERHPWHSRVKDLDHPDWLVFDLDPGEGVEFETICELALRTREALARLGLECYPKTSGSRGIHVYLPCKPTYEYEQVAEFAERLATLVAREHPQIATVERSLKKRKRGQIYVDHMQNARGKSVVSPYSVRPREGAPVSAPLEWREVERKKITPRDFTIKNILKRLEKRGDLFRPVLAGRQNLEEAFEHVKILLREKRTKRAP